ncbi:MAG TPA: ATP-binding protein [Ohtaekwangia sp.]|nr:ATP-binding protein [Ohtaekwangia sp.]
MGSNIIELQLRERVKELKCLYELSRIAWDTSNNVDVILHKLLKILPAAMQHAKQAEARITLDGVTYDTERFNACKYKIQAELLVNEKLHGVVEVAYRQGPAINSKKPFLPEEKKLLHTVSRELAFMIRRSETEEEKQKLQTKLQHVERLAFVGELSAGIAHELNEPLGRILGFAQLIKKGGSLNDQQDADIERIIKASLYTREIIKKLMLFSRQMPQQISEVNLNQIIEDILYFIDVGYQSNQIRIERKLVAEIPVIRADSVQMTQMLVNLITNAIHAMPDGGTLTITTHYEQGNIKLSVKDTGHGMASDVRKKIFEPFFTTKPIGQGTGLGLSVVQGIVDSHEGKIMVRSTPGKGSKFEVLLPVKRKGNKLNEKKRSH